MKVSGVIAGLAIVGACATAGASTPPPSMPAVWTSHSLILDLHNLPKRYTCDELWYKFKGVLTALGARTDESILPYRCERGAGSDAYSPEVQLKFSMPSIVSGRNVRWADLQVQPRAIRLQSGSPQHIDADDCKLLNQIRNTLLPYLGAAVTEFNLPCQAVQSAHAPFGLTVQALIPVYPPQPPVASTAADARPDSLSARRGS